MREAGTYKAECRRRMASHVNSLQISSPFAGGAGDPGTPGGCRERRGRARAPAAIGGQTPRCPLRPPAMPKALFHATARSEPVLNFCANNYLGLSSHPSLVQVGSLP